MALLQPQSFSKENKRNTIPPEKHMHTRTSAVPLEKSKGLTKPESVFGETPVLCVTILKLS